MYEKIVVGTDGSAGAGIAVDAAIELARLSGATLHIVHAFKIVSAHQAAAGTEMGAMPIDVRETNDATRAISQQICDEAAKRAADAGVTTETHCVASDPSDALIRVAEDAKADLLVVGNRGMTSKKRFVLGSVPNKVSHHCPASLLIVDTSQARA